MIDQKTTNQEYPLPNPSNKLSADVLRIQDTFEKIDVDVGVLHTASTNASTDLNNIRSGSVWQATATGFGGAYDVSLTPSPSSLVAGQIVYMKAHTQNTGPATLKIDTLDAKTIKKTDGSDLKAGDIVAGAICDLHYDGINFQLLNPKVDQEQIEVITSNLMLAFEEIQENHGGSLNMETGWSDSFGNTNEQGADEANSSGYQHDPTDKLYKGIDGGTGLDHDQDYSVESNYLQQEWNTSNQSTGLATFTNGSTTATIASGSWPANIANMRIKNDAEGTWYDVQSRDSNTQITLATNYVATTDSSANWTARATEFKSGTAQINESFIETLDQSYTGTITHAEMGKDDLHVHTGNQRAQSFVAGSTGNLSSVILGLQIVGSPTDNVVVGIYSANGTGTGATPNALLSSEETIPASSLTTSHAEYRFEFSSPASITSGTTYCIVIYRSSGTNDASNYYRWTSDEHLEYGNGYRFYKYTSSSWTLDSNTGHDMYFKTYIEGSKNNVINEPACIIPTFANLWSISNLSDLNSVTSTETLNSQSAGYFMVRGPSGMTAYADTDTEIVVWNAASGKWKSAVRYDGTNWQINTNTGTDDTIVSWSNAAIDDMLHAIAEAYNSNTVFQCTGDQLAAISDADLEQASGSDTAGGINIGTHTQMVWAVVLKSTSSTQNPNVDQIRTNYDSQRAAMDLRSKTYNPGFVTSEAYLWARAEHSDSDGAGTFSVSRNSGAQWEVVPMAQQGLSFGDIRVMRGTVDLGAQPSGQDLRCRYQTAQGKDQFLHSWGLQAKS